ncbi:MAG: prepilin-type N-terminal cleavage/methylation domain-containing protein [Elusimicrobiaceae bacterium]
MSAASLRRGGFTLLETLIVLFIIAVGTAIAVRSVGSSTVKARENEAQARAKVVWEAEKRYFAYKGLYTDNWAILGVPDPSLIDRFYNFTIYLDSNAGMVSFHIYVAKKDDGSSGFKMMGTGEIVALK